MKGEQFQNIANKSRNVHDIIHIENPLAVSARKEKTKQTDRTFEFSDRPLSNRILKKLYRSEPSIIEVRCALSFLQIKSFKKGTDAYFSSMILVTI
jgi:hypothetical protein